MKVDPAVYAEVLRQHLATRPAAVQHEPVETVLRPEKVFREETDYANGSEDNYRGTGEGSVKEHKVPEIQ